jgi:hypothetical protein
MPPVGFEPTIPGSARPQTYTLDRAATGIGPTHILDVLLNGYLKENDVTDVGHIYVLCHWSLLSRMWIFTRQSADYLKRRRTSVILRPVTSGKMFIFVAYNPIYFTNHISSPQGDWSSGRPQLSTTAFPKLNPS